MICTPAERDLIVAGATRLVVAGEPMEDWHGEDGLTFVAPQRWVDATGPCPTYDGSRWVVTGDLMLSGRWVRCPDCIDGRKREALQRACSVCALTPEIVCTMPVPFAYATVEVLPVGGYEPGEFRQHVAGDRWVSLLPDAYNASGAWLFEMHGRRMRHTDLSLDPLPVPGRDWVVLLDNVEVVT